MSKAHNKDGFFLDIGLLRNHVSDLREQRKTASKLYNSVIAMRNCSDPAEAYTYNAILRDIERLIAYLDRMASELSKVADDAVYVSRKIGAQIQQDTAYTRHIITNSIML